MLFNSLEFLIFAPIALLGHTLLRGSALRWWLIVMSYVFYGWAEPWYCLLLLGSTLLDFNVGWWLGKVSSPGIRRGLLIASLVGNLGLLAAFKYMGFFAQTLNELLASVGISASVPIPEIPLPVGISFYTFQTLSYTIDVYRGKLTPTKSFSTFALYVAFFPQLVAGPIERATHLLHQLAEKCARTTDDVLIGITRILWGLLKKAVFADWLGICVRSAYGDVASATAGDLLLATYAFAFQIYLDFSAYSDIAIGLARIMGINICENFQWPYLARNISEFWRRWHISLSTWLRDYLFIPLGGSKGANWRTGVNLIIVMFLGGLWHGADKKFIVWGLWLGLALAIYHTIVHALGRKAVGPDAPFRWFHIPSILFTFHIVLVSWVFFAANSMGDALLVFKRLLASQAQWSFSIAPDVVQATQIILLIAILAHIARGLQWTRPLQRVRNPIMLGVAWGVLAALTIVFMPAESTKFIYFQF